MKDTKNKKKEYKAKCTLDICREHEDMMCGQCKKETLQTKQ